MKKAERLNDMLLYLKDKKAFQLKDIMRQYGISKSTALRDVQSLEEMGMPIYSVSGRNGHYGILSNRLLSPIIFTMDEIYALYFSMQTLTAYQSTPFHLSMEKLKQKFEGCISQGQKESLHKMELVFQLGSPQNKNVCGCLKDIVSMAASETVCEICYRKAGSEKRYQVQFFNITSAYGQWYATAYNFKTQKPQVFRCDKISSVMPCGKYAAKPLAEFQITAREMFREKDAVDFTVEITSRGADIFYKEQYPSMQLHREEDSFCIKGFYNKGEETFIADYFNSYGDTLLSVSPVSLKKLMVNRLDAIRARVLSLGLIH